MNKRYKENFLKAGKLASQVRAFGKSLIVKGASYNEVIRKVNLKIKELGAIPAFPPQIALNDVAAHFLPQPDEDIIFSNQIIKLDIGVCYEGAIGDCAGTVDLSGNYQYLIDAAEAALLAAEKSVKVGLPVREIGRAIETVAASFGVNPVRNLCGHGLGYYKIHTDPKIPNYDDKSRAVIQAGMTFAIEPFMTNGKGMIYDAGKPAIFSLVGNKLPSSEWGRVGLAKIKTFNGLPFAIHDLIDSKFSLSDAQIALAELFQIGAVAGYPPLVEQAHGMVAQAENSILVDDDGQVTVTTR